MTKPVGNYAALNAGKIIDTAERRAQRLPSYCSELLSLIGKLAALYAQSHGDQHVAQTVTRSRC